MKPPWSGLIGALLREQNDKWGVQLTGATIMAIRSHVAGSAPLQERLDQLHRTYDANASRERLTLVRLLQWLRRQGYEGSYDAGGETRSSIR